MNNDNEIKITPILDTLKFGTCPDEEYFKIKAVSNSRLKLINPLEDGSPEKYNENISSEYNASFNVGTPIHQMILQKQFYYLDHSVVKPSGKLNNVVDCIINNRNKNYSIYDSIRKACETVDYYKNKITDNRIHLIIKECLDFYINSKKVVSKKIPIFLDKNNRNSVIGCVAELDTSKKANNVLYPNDCRIFNEFYILIDFKITFPNKTEKIIPFKAKLDNFSINYNLKEIIVNDLKSTSKDVSEFANSYYKYHYFRQVGIYSYLTSLVCKNVFNLQYEKLYSNMVVVSTIPNYNSLIFKVYNEDITNGILEFKELISRVAFHEIYGYDKKFEDKIWKT